VLGAFGRFAELISRIQASRYTSNATYVYWAVGGLGPAIYFAHLAENLTAWVCLFGICFPVGLLAEATGPYVVLLGSVVARIGVTIACGAAYVVRILVCLPFGLTVALTSPLIDVSADGAPFGRWAVFTPQGSADMANMEHSSHGHRSILKAIGDWMQARAYQVSTTSNTRYDAPVTNENSPGLSEPDARHAAHVRHLR
jgi:hypothetical protein